MLNKYEIKIAQDIFGVLLLSIVVMKFSLGIFMLFMFTLFSRPRISNQFDKVCKLKFLDFLDDIYSDREDAQNAIKENLSRYLLRLEATARK